MIMMVNKSAVWRCRSSAAESNLNIVIASPTELGRKFVATLVCNVFALEVCCIRD